VTVPGHRLALLAVWRTRGSKNTATAFAKRPPELDLPER